MAARWKARYGIKWGNYEMELTNQNEARAISMGKSSKNIFNVYKKTKIYLSNVFQLPAVATTVIIMVRMMINEPILCSAMTDR